MNVSKTTERGPATEKVNQCRNCRSYISHRFARVFGNNDNEVHRCPSCANFTSLRNGDGGVTD